MFSCFEKKKVESIYEIPTIGGPAYAKAMAKNTDHIKEYINKAIKELKNNKVVVIKCRKSSELISYVATFDIPFSFYGNYLLILGNNWIDVVDKIEEEEFNTFTENVI